MALRGLSVIEFAGLAPGPFAGLVLAHHGASVTRIDRPSFINTDVLCAGKRSVVLDLKSPAGIAVARRLIARADVLIDPFRPGVMERMGLGPQYFHDSEGSTGINDRLVYARVAGFPPDGPHKSMAGHEINYLALSGVLSILPGTREKPTFPLNLLADFSGGGLMCATGILLALVERCKSGRGQVVDVNMVSGTRYVSSFPLLHATNTSPLLGGPRGTNLLDGGAPFYDVYTCSDGKWMSVGCLEPQFFVTFIDIFRDALRMNGLKPTWTPTPETPTRKEDWPKLRAYLENGFKIKPRDYWASLFHGSDACVVPVLTPKEAALLDPSKSARPSPHPHLSRTPPLPQPVAQSGMVLEPGLHTREVLVEAGLSGGEIKQLALDGAFGEETKHGTISSCKL
ncbi:CoA-transferase family III [Pisolithus marmoratus]|nr:CoA-transferase family III [Pisolithus marmoratus]